MNELSIRNQEKVLKTLIKLCYDYPTSLIYQPKNFTDNFNFISVESLIIILRLLEDKKLIYVCYANLPESFNIHTIEITPAGYDYHPQKQLRTAERWRERLYGFVFGTVLGAVVTYIIPLIANLLSGK